MPSNPQARRSSCVGAAFGRQPDLARLPSSGQAAERETPGASRKQRSSLLLQSKINKTSLGEMRISGAGHFPLPGNTQEHFCRNLIYRAYSLVSLALHSVSGSRMFGPRFLVAAGKIEE